MRTHTRFNNQCALGHQNIGWHRTDMRPGSCPIGAKALRVKLDICVIRDCDPSHALINACSINAPTWIVDLE